jgi:hypothetical protein
MTPTDTIIALEKALEAGPTQEWKDARLPNGHGMGWSAGPNAWLGTDSYSKETAASAALIAACSPLAIRTLLDAHASALADSKRLDWLETQGYAYGFQDMHEGNRWTVEGPYSTVRKAIDDALAALDDNTKGAAE